MWFSIFVSFYSWNVGFNEENCLIISQDILSDFVKGFDMSKHSGVWYLDEIIPEWDDTWTAWYNTLKVNIYFRCLSLWHKRCYKHKSYEVIVKITQSTRMRRGRPGRHARYLALPLLQHTSVTKITPKRSPHWLRPTSYLCNKKIKEKSC